MTDINIRRKLRARGSWLLYASEHVGQHLQGCVNVYSTTPSCPPPSVWASALHNSLFLCVGLAACVRVIHCFTAHTRDGSQWRSTALYNSFRPHKDFLFLSVAAFTRFFFSPPCILLPARTQMPFWLSVHCVRSADVWVCSCTVCVGFKHIFASCLHSSLPAYSIM